MQNTIKILQEHYDAIRHSLFNEDGNERAAFCFVDRNTKNGNQFYVRGIYIPDESDYEISTRYFNKLTPDGQIKVINAWRASGCYGIMEEHSHPFAKSGIFSAIDNKNVEEFREDLLRRKKDGFFMRMVMGSDESGFSCFVTEDGEEVPVSEIIVIGKKSMRRIVSVVHESRATTTELSAISEESRFSRTIQWMGKTAQDKIQSLRVLYVGAGGLMNAFVTFAKNAGFRKMTIVDFDKVELKNFNRLLGVSLADVGKYKADVLMRELKFFDNDIDVTVIKSTFQDAATEGHLWDVDVIVSGVDNDETRVELQLFAARHMIPWFDMGTGIFLDDSLTSVAQKGGQIRAYIPGGACISCQGLDLGAVHSNSWYEARKAAGYITQSNESPGSVITFNVVIAGMALSMLLDYTTGCNAIPSYAAYDELTYSVLPKVFQPQATCPICGEHGIVGAGEEKATIPVKPRETVDELA